MPPSTVRAAELATFAFCQRAWFYARTGVLHEHHDVMQLGTQWHEAVERQTRRAILLTRFGTLLLLSGIGLFILQSLTN